MTLYCTECALAWHPYQAAKGACPICGSGTVRRNQPASDEAGVLFELVKVERARKHRCERFEAYYRKLKLSQEQAA